MIAITAAPDHAVWLLIIASAVPNKKPRLCGAPIAVKPEVIAALVLIQGREVRLKDATRLTS